MAKDESSKSLLICFIVFQILISKSIGVTAVIYAWFDIKIIRTYQQVPSNPQLPWAFIKAQTFQMLIVSHTCYWHTHN
jgi:hypothetical protein